VVRKAVNAGAGREQRLDMFSLVIWSSLVPPIPLLVLAFFLHTPEELSSAIQSFDLTALLAVIYLAFAATLFGFGTWSKLLSRYPASQVAPLSLLVPVTGLLTANLVLGERLVLLQWAGCILILCGLGTASLRLRSLRRAVVGHI